MADKNEALDERNLKAAAVLNLLSVEEMERILDADIFELMGATNLTVETKEHMSSIIQETVKNRTLVRVLDALTPEEEKEFMDLVDDTDPKKAEDYLVEHGIDINGMAMVELMLYKFELSKGKAGK